MAVGMRKHCAGQRGQTGPAPGRLGSGLCLFRAPDLRSASGECPVRREDAFRETDRQCAAYVRGRHRCFTWNIAWRFEFHFTAYPACQARRRDARHAAKEQTDVARHLRGKMTLFHVEQCEVGEACERQPRRREARVKFCFPAFCPIHRKRGAPSPQAGSRWQTNVAQHSRGEGSAVSRGTARRCREFPVRRSVVPSGAA